MEKRISYYGVGFVLGYYWGGGKGAYKSREIFSDSMEDFVRQVNEGIKDGSLDGGMGFECLLGAGMVISTITKVEVEGKVYTNIENELEFFGELTENDEQFLMDLPY